MSLLDLILLLVVAGICGSLAQSIAGYSHRGFLASIGLGEVLPLHVGDRMFPIVWSIIGAALFVTVLHLVRPRASG